MPKVETSIGGNPVWTINASSGSESYPLPAGFASGRNITVRREDSSGNTVTLTVASGETLDGTLNGTVTVPGNVQGQLYVTNPGIWESYGLTSVGGGLTGTGGGAVTTTAQVAADGALTGAFAPGADTMTVARLDRAALQMARSRSAAASVAYSDAVEFTHDWSNLTGWQNTAVSVSGNKLYATGTSNPVGALKSFPVGSGERAHITTVMNFKAGAGNPQATYFGIDLGTADHTIAASSPEGVFVGWDSSGNINHFIGASAGVTVLDASSSGAMPAVDTSFHASLDVDASYVSLSLISLTDPAIWRSIKFSRVGKNLNNISFFIQDARATSGHSFGPVAAVKSLQPVRTKTIASVSVENVAPRRISTRSAAADPWQLSLPTAYDPRLPAPVCLFFHQSLTGSANSPWAETRMQPVTAALNAAGYIVAGALDGGDRWGNTTSIANYLALYQYVRDNFATGPLVMYSSSMGCLPMLNALATRSFNTPAAAASVGGVCDLSVLYANPTYAPGITSAYGIAGDGSDYAAKTAGYNPMLRAGAEFRGVPVRFYTSTGDTTVPKASNSDAMAAKLLPYAPEATVVLGSGGHLDVTQYQASNLVSFFNTYI